MATEYKLSYTASEIDKKLGTIDTLATELENKANTSDIPTSLKNPNVMKINGVSYDGSATVDFTTKINDLIDAKLGVIENGSY